MGEIAQEYLIPDGTSPQEIKDLIRTRTRFSEDPALDVARRFMDGFDWSLYRAGVSVEDRTDGTGRRLLWQDLRGDGASCAQAGRGTKSPGTMPKRPQP